MQSIHLTDFVSVHVSTQKMMTCVTLSKKKNVKLIHAEPLLGFFFFIFFIKKNLILNSFFFIIFNFSF